MKRILLILGIIGIGAFNTNAQVNISDSSALTDFYNQTGGTSWTQQHSWLSGPVSTWQGVTLTGDRVTELRLPENNLTGDRIGGPLSRLTMLKVIDLSINQLSGNIPDTFYFLPNLVEVDFSHNIFIGKIPRSLSVKNSLTKIDVSHNQLSGTIPQDLCNLPNLLELRLNDNHFTFDGMECIAGIAGSIYGDQGRVPLEKKNDILTLNVGGTAANKIYTWYRDGALYATIPQDSSFSITEIGSYSVKVSNAAAPQLILESDTILIDATRYSDSLTLRDIFAELNGEAWTDNINWLSEKPAATWSGVTVEEGKVTVLDLSDRSLSGDVRRRTESLHISRNMGIGLSDALRNLTALKWLSLANNNLSGQIPAAISSLTNLTYLSLRNNAFSGPVPQDICDHVSLTTIDISHNEFNFDGMECIGLKDGTVYDAQKSLTITDNNPGLAVTAGGSLTKNTYTWYKNNTLLESRTGDSTLAINTAGIYHVVVTNTDASQLDLISVPLSISEVLPLKWIDFTAIVCSEKICLRWTTQNEYNTSHFEIERSNDGTHFKRIHTITSKNTSGKITYEYADAFTGPKLVFYRIKQIDRDGKFSYSKVISASRIGDYFIGIHPNPANDYFVLQGNSHPVKIILYNSLGIIMGQWNGIKEGASIYIGNLKPGVYITRIIGKNNEGKILRLMKH